MQSSLYEARGRAEPYQQHSLAAEQSERVGTETAKGKEF